MSEPFQLPLEEPTQRCVNPDCNKRGTLDEHGLCLVCRAELEAERADIRAEVGE